MFFLVSEACAKTLSELVTWVDEVPCSLPAEMRPMAESICASFQAAAVRLMELGLSYLTLDRAASTLSTGERQRMQLARAGLHGHGVMCHAMRLNFHRFSLLSQTVQAWSNSA